MNTMKISKDKRIDGSVSITSSGYPERVRIVGNWIGDWSCYPFEGYLSWAQALVMKLQEQATESVKDLQRFPATLALKELIENTFCRLENGFLWLWDSTGTWTKVAIVLGIVAAVGAPVGINALGFRAVGVSVNSFAANWQSTIGNVPAGSVFAILQSVGVNGLQVSAKVAVGATTSTIVLVPIKEAVGKLASLGQKAKNIMSRNCILKSKL